MAHENALINANSVKQRYHERGIVLHRLEIWRWLALLPARQLRHMGESNGTQCHVIRFPSARTAHTVQTQHWLCVCRMATFEIRDIKATDLHPVACKDGAIRCS